MHALHLSVAVHRLNISYHRLQHCTQSDTWKAVGSCWKAVGSCWKSVWRSVITNRSATQATPTPMNWTTSMLGWSNSRLSDQNRTRSWFLNDLNILTIDTFLVFNLAALACRRDIAMPGLIHRTVLGTGPNHFYSWIEVDINPPRLSQRLNPTQGRRIVERPDLIRLEIGQWSLFGLIRIYNLLPETISNGDAIPGTWYGRRYHVQRPRPLHLKTAARMNRIHFIVWV